MSWLATKLKWIGTINGRGCKAVTRVGDTTSHRPTTDMKLSDPFHEFRSLVIYRHSSRRLHKVDPLNSPAPVPCFLPPFQRRIESRPLIAVTRQLTQNFLLVHFQGWSKFYEFSFADLRSGADIVSIAVQQVAQKGPFPWDFLRGLLENAIYGGRIDNRFDVQVLRAYLHQFFNEGMLDGVGGSQKALPGTKGVTIPASLKHGDYLKVLGELQEGDTPSMFGLPANIERNVQQTNR
jgi:hypothetical protein